MTVKQLINCLKELPQDAMVVEYAPPEQGYIGGYNRVQTFLLAKLHYYGNETFLISNFFIEKFCEETDTSEN